MTLFDDQKIKLKSAHNHKINETLNASWIFSKSQEHWFFLEKWSQKKKEMNQMHKINEIYLRISKFWDLEFQIWMEENYNHKGYAWKNFPYDTCLLYTSDAADE